MQDTEFPSLLARAFIGAAPKPALDLGAVALLAAMRRNHPHLFAVLAEQRQTRILVELTDLGVQTLEQDRRQREGWLALAIAEDLSAEEQRVLMQAVALLRRLAED